jgi:hypothetical protein
MEPVRIPTDGSYKHARHFGPFARMHPGEYMGMNLPRKGEKMYPFELVIFKTDAFAVFNGLRSPAAVAFRYCLS